MCHIMLAFLVLFAPSIFSAAFPMTGLFCCLFIFFFISFLKLSTIKDDALVLELGLSND